MGLCILVTQFWHTVAFTLENVVTQISPLCQVVIYQVALLRMLHIANVVL